MNKYKTGTYTITVFDEYGSKHETHFAQCYTDALVIAEKQQELDNVSSTVIQHNMYNSIDKNKKWEYKK